MDPYPFWPKQDRRKRCQRFKLSCLKMGVFATIIGPMAGLLDKPLVVRILVWGVLEMRVHTG